MRPPVGIENVSAFLEGISKWHAGYSSVALHYFGEECDGRVDLWVARLFLRIGEPAESRITRVAGYQAGIERIGTAAAEIREFVSALAEGKEVALPSGLRVILPVSDHVGIHINQPQYLTTDGLSVGKRWSVLAIEGGMSSAIVPRAEIDWSLKAASEPYDSVSELLAELSLGPQAPLRRRFEVVAGNVVEVWAQSRVNGETAEIGLWIPKTLDRSLARLGYRIVVPGIPVRRGTLSVEELSWRDVGQSQVGSARLEVAVGAVVQCLATCGDATHHSYWLVDPQHFRNPRLRAYSAFDDQLKSLLLRLMPAAGAKGAVSRNFEWAIAGALWAYGFSPLLLEPADQSADSPDILAVAPGGGIVIVECTTGMLKAGTKLANLSRRAVQLRDRISDGSLLAPAVLPVIVTALSRSEVAAELDAATDLGILVITREGLESSQHEMLAYWNGDALFQRGLAALEAAKDELANRRRPPSRSPQDNLE